MLKALALGARAVLIGRAFIWALAAAGEDGVRQLLATFEQELAGGLALLGCRSPAELTRAHLGRSG
ncbi:MAG TPA: alpha-hydroxy-acid oxidizing protein [Gaiellaceae bacterium]